ncbi:MAG: hypothetical protein ACP5QG_07640, partial [candidate division WOR-3 bacterium]
MKPMSLTMGITLGLAIVLMTIGMAWPLALFWGVATLLALPPVGIIGAMVGMARARRWRYFWLGILLLALMGLAVFVGFL